MADVQAFVKAIESASSIDPEKVHDAIAKVDFDSLYGRIRFNSAGQINLPQTVVQVQKGKLVPIYGPKGLLEQPLYPMQEWSKR